MHTSFLVLIILALVIVVIDHHIHLVRYLTSLAGRKRKRYRLDRDSTGRYGITDGYLSIREEIEKIIQIGTH